MQLRSSFPVIGAFAAFVLAGVGVVMAEAQGGAPAGVAIDAAGSFEVGGVRVDVSGKDAEAARQGGWRIAQRKGWDMLSRRLTGKPGALPDSVLDSIVTGIVVEREQIGPNRYIASLGVLFDRGKAGSILGVTIAVSHSPPMLLVPLQFSGGTGEVFERDTAWARAWNRFRTGGSTIDYVRLRGTGADRLLVNAGQTLRRGRNWWRAVLDQYGARDLIVAEVQLRRDYPGGPIVGVFAANHGPDRVPITRFALRVENDEALDALLDAGVARIDRACQDALANGRLRTDALLAARPPVAQPSLPETDETVDPSATPMPTPRADAGDITTLSVQIETPNAAAITASEAALRGLTGVRSVATTSLALGGISVMRIGYDGPQASLRAALEARGWTVQEGPGVLRIRRGTDGGGGAPQPPASPRATATPRGQ